MKETYFAGAYWLGRGESVEACARRASAFFQFLSEIEPAWSRWCETADSFETASLRPVSTDMGSLREHFSRQDRRIGDAYTYWLWSGLNPDETVGCDGICGSADLWTPSSCVLSTSGDGSVSTRFLTASSLAQVIRQMVFAWEPEFGLVTSNAHFGSLDPDAEMGMLVGWMTYFSRQRGPVPPLPAPVRVEPVGDLGTLVTLTQERFTVSNPQHVRLAAEVQRVLEGAGLMHPLRPL
jgi:hypothetical protein